MAIEACGPVKAFGAIRAVDCLDLSVPNGDVFPLLAPNGAGKPITELRHSLPSKCWAFEEDRGEAKTRSSCR